MNGYKRMKNVSTARSRSRSVDFLDISFKSNTPRKPISNSSSNGIPPPDSSIKIPEKAEGNESEESGGEIFGVILNKKSSSVSSSSSRSYSYPCIADEHQKEKESGAASVQSALKRVFSMKRSSSVSEGYSRIHHQSDPILDADHATRKGSSKKKGKFFATFRRVFLFQ